MIHDSSATEVDYYAYNLKYLLAKRVSIRQFLLAFRSYQARCTPPV